MNNIPEISVIIPTYNRADTLMRAIQSILDQTYSGWELIIVDDASTDDTTSLLKTYNDPRFRLIRHPANRGQSAAINTGVQHAQGNYVCFLDSDDEYLPAALQKQIELFHNSPKNVGAVYIQTGERLYNGSFQPSHFNMVRGNVYRQVLWQGYLAPSISFLVRRDIFSEIGGFDESFSCFQDDDFCMRLTQYCPVEFVPELLAVVNRDASGQLTRDRNKYALGWYSLLEKHRLEILKECGADRLARHYVRASWLFLKSRQMTMSFLALKKANQLCKSPGNFLAVMFNAINEKINKC